MDRTGRHLGDTGMRVTKLAIKCTYLHIVSFLTPGAVQQVDGMVGASFLLLKVSTVHRDILRAAATRFCCDSGSHSACECFAGRSLVHTFQTPTPEKDALRVLEAIVSGRVMGLDEKLGAHSTVKQLVATGRHA